MTSFKQAFKMFMWMTLLTGVIYPALITVVAQTVMSGKANGSLITVDGIAVGSELIGQNFSDDKNFWSRPSAIGCNPQPSGGSNLSLTSKALQERLQLKSKAIGGDDVSSLNAIPSDLLFASASGLDPHITLRAALFQIKRISAARNLSAEQIHRLEGLVYAAMEESDDDIFGGEIVNVLKLNLALKRAF